MKLISEFQRARNKEHKRQRWDEIIHSPLYLFEKNSYANITIRDIAKKNIIHPRKHLQICFYKRRNISRNNFKRSQKLD